MVWVQYISFVTRNEFETDFYRSIGVTVRRRDVGVERSSAFTEELSLTLARCSLIAIWTGAYAGR